jgi:hypothetical protein
MGTEMLWQQTRAIQVLGQQQDQNLVKKAMYARNTFQGK